MHKRWFYRNDTGRIDVHALKMSWKNHDAYKNYRHQLKAVTDWASSNYNYYKNNVINTLWVNIDRLNNNKKCTQLALRNNLSIVPFDKYTIGHELREWNFSIVPTTSLLPTPVKTKRSVLAA